MDKAQNPKEQIKSSATGDQGDQQRAGKTSKALDRIPIWAICCSHNLAE
jgi:hypothetical protein